MSKLWLAAVLGIILGVGIAYSTAVPVASPANMAFNTQLPQPPEILRQTGQSARAAQPDWKLAFISLLVGIVVAAPVFLIAKRRE